MQDDSRQRLRRIAEELRVAVGKTERDALASWGVRTAARVPRGVGKRAGRVARLLGRLSIAIVNEALDAVRNRGNLREHLTERGGAAAGAGVEIGVATAGAARDLGSFALRVRSEPEVVAPVLLGSVAGFVVGSGGLDTDGGIPDLDLAFGIGSHRSIFTHSIIGGAVAEAVILGTLDLVLLVHEKLPAKRDRIWGELRECAVRFADAMRRGTDLGIGVHVAADGSGVDGFTPYKDLPVGPLPEEAHRIIMGLNALGEADAAVQSRRAETKEPENEAAIALAGLLSRSSR